MKQVNSVKDMDGMKIGDKFTYHGREYTLYDYSGTIARDYETFKVWNSKGKITHVKIKA